jgi:hypothetical protein
MKKVAKKSVAKKTATKKTAKKEKPVESAEKPTTRPVPLGGRGSVHVPAPVVPDDATKTIKGLVVEANVIVDANLKSHEPAFTFVVNSQSLVNVVHACCRDCEFQYGVRVNANLSVPAQLKARKGQ